MDRRHIDDTIQIRLSILMRPDPDPDPIPSYALVGKSEFFLCSQQCTGVIIFNILDITYIENFLLKVPIV